MVRSPVIRATRQIRIIKDRTSLINKASEDLINEVSAKVLALANNIPLPPTLGISEILDLLTCPLLPKAILVDPEIINSLTPEEIFRKIQENLQQYINKLQEDFIESLRLLAEWETIAKIKQYLNDLLTIEFDAVALADAVACVSFVKFACPDEFKNNVYQEIILEAKTFSLDGIFPSNLSLVTRDVCDALLVAKRRIGAWRELASAPIPTS